jgi:hypothetical protein
VGWNDLLLAKQVEENSMTEQLVFSHISTSRKFKSGSFTLFLIKKQTHQVARKPKKRTFGSAKGKYQLAPDFDAPLNDFKDYK